MDKEEGIASRCKPEGSRDNGKMITSLLPLMSVLTLARVPALEDMCTDIIRHILQVQTFLTLMDLKDLYTLFKYPSISKLVCLISNGNL